MYKAPPFLIIHLKRFDHTPGYASKINDLIKFPIENLNLEPFIATQGGVYDLYAVSNHFGNLEGGHYTAFAKNPVHDKWFHFDDSTVQHASEEDIVNSAAYVLFYKRRSS